MNVIRDTLQSTTQLAALISMNVRCTMETALRSVSTRKAVTCVSAARDTMLLTLSKYSDQKSLGHLQQTPGVDKINQ